VLLGYLLLWMLLFKGRYILLAPLQEGSYQSSGENAVVVAGAWVLYAWLAVDWDRRRLGFATGAKGVRIARVFYGLAMLAFGFSHFFYLELTARSSLSGSRAMCSGPTSPARLISRRVWRYSSAYPRAWPRCSRRCRWPASCCWYGSP